VWEGYGGWGGARKRGGRRKPAATLEHENHLSLAQKTRSKALLGGAPRGPETLEGNPKKLPNPPVKIETLGERKGIIGKWISHEVSGGSLKKKNGQRKREKKL